MEQYILPLFLTSSFVAVMTTITKKIIISIKRARLKKLKVENIEEELSKTSDTIFRAMALFLSAVAVILSWWILKTPAELKACILYFFPVYVFQEIFDLDVIKRIIKAVTKAKLKKAGVSEEDLDFFN